MSPTNRIPQSPRDLAFIVLKDARTESVFVDESLDRRLNASDLSPQDRGFAMELVYGVTRRKMTLDAVITNFVDRPRKSIEDDLWLLLQLGVYQLLMLDSIPSHAAVHETVEVGRRVGSARWTGLLNGVLRAVSRNVTEEYTTELAADAVPQTAGQFRKFPEPVFDDPQKQPVRHFASAFSFPRWLVKRWHRRFSLEEMTALGFWFNTPPPLWLRVNPVPLDENLETSREQLLAQLRELDLECRAGELPEAIEMQSQVRPESLPGFADGLFAVQDLTAMRAATWLDPQPGESVLDLCAAPGGKTTHLAERMQNQGRLIATDIRPQRLDRVIENATRLRLTIVEPQLIQADGSDTPDGPFDAVLVDAPCSNTGVLGRRPDARWRIRPDDLQELRPLQERLLKAACDRVGSGGRVLYSTCSIEPEENREVVDAVLAERPEMQFTKDQTHHPGRPADGGYLALLHRK
ncbi:16S rRNA (cytosine(967)-C(5))-methyltransferase RsmB [Thalassoroseus pseudoceratinae]|uniref:16S rRNA (cytosine(967)-C(5))-methyltransferase RsmB n=1 Tax=Thalassoroseus pseudoceratinae TaxID=2713176 RepID=UPI00142482AE|nr:16S rRNA (cytosine(967)-C(5))-methyltransferase RsmB [Thalassoroseus pseudoceratinae]